MKILLCHAYYTQRGGEDQSFEEERDLLRGAGHDVIEYTRRNEDLNSASGVLAATTTIWNGRAARDVATLVAEHRPQVVHVTNTFPLISPAACRAAHRGGAAVVQALRNYRLLCAGAYLLRDGRPCEDCLGRAVPLAAIRHGCYRDSRAASAAVVAMQVAHRALGTWRNSVDAFFTLTEFARAKFVAAGFSAERVHVKKNSVGVDVPPRFELSAADDRGDFVVFAGRLSPEKGIATLLAAWRRQPALPRLVIAGDGPLANEVRAASAADSRIDYRGALPLAEVHGLMAQAGAVVMPSLWYETFGRAIAEAYAVGTPVVASRLGAMEELVEEGKTGWLFTAGDATVCARAVTQLSHQTPDERIAMRRRARAAYDHAFTPDHNYRRLMEIYSLAMIERRRRAGLTAPATGAPLAALDSHLEAVVR